MATQFQVTANQLRSFVERIERLEEEKAGLAADVREVYAEARSQGYDTKVMRQLISLRKLDQADRREREELLETYKAAIGMG